MGTGPISTNAPFNEFGQSMILRDVEQLYLLRQSLQNQVSSLDSSLSDLTSTVDANAAAGSGTIIPTGNLTVLATPGSGTYTIPAGSTRVLAFMVAAGGGDYNGSGTLIGYISTSSGGAVTYPLTFIGSRAGGGGAILALLDVTGIASLSYTIGAAGTGPSATPTDGGATTLADGSDYTLTANGGFAASATYQGPGGDTASSGTRARLLWALGFSGDQGSGSLSASGLGGFVDVALGSGGARMRPLFPGVSATAGSHNHDGVIALLAA